VGAGELIGVPTLSFSGADADVEHIEQAWRPIEPAVFQAYEEITALKFRRQSYDCLLDPALPISGYTRLVRHAPAIRVQHPPSSDAARITLIHELAHVVALEHTGWHLRKLASLWVVAPTLRIAAVTDHLLANVLHEAVARRALTAPEPALALARGWRGHAPAWRAIDRQPEHISRIVLGRRFDRAGRSA
jgi:hypothetical protein